MAITATAIRKGTVIVFNGDPHRVVDFHHHTPGNLRAFVQAKLRNLRSGAIFEHRFRAADTIEKASVMTQELQFLYSDANHYHFMNVENYDQIELSEEVLGDAAQWLSPNMVIQAQMYEGQPIGIDLPSTLELRVDETEPALPGATKTAMTKPAKLENGVIVQVPPFVGPGEMVRVDPHEGKYLERAR
jgi:elongation factor P